MAVPGSRLNHPGATSFVQLEGLSGDDKLHGLPAFPCASIPHASVEPPPSAMNPSAGTNQDSCHSLRGGRVLKFASIFFGFGQRLRGLCPFFGRPLREKMCKITESGAQPRDLDCSWPTASAPVRCGCQRCTKPVFGRRTLRHAPADGVKRAAARLSVIGVKLPQGGDRSAPVAISLGRHFIEETLPDPSADRPTCWAGVQVA